MSWSDSDDDLLLVAATQSQTKPSETSVSALSKTGKCTTKQKKQSWVSSSFDDFDDFGRDVASSQPSSKSKGKAKKRPREKDHPAVDNSERTSTIQANRPASGSQELWYEKHTPWTSSELAVHKKKIGEVHDWLQHHFTTKCVQAPMLLLTGPSGAGKTACIQVLAREMKCKVQEWLNPVTEEFRTGTMSWEDAQSFSSVGIPRSESQARLFQDFLLRANKYPTLSIFNQDQLYRKLILVEDFPNVFFRNSGQFHEILRNYQRRGHCPLVFIVSDSVAGESSERVLFPKHIQAELNISNISFNPVAPTSLTKVLSRIANTEASKAENRRLLSVPDKSSLDALASSSNGDIRGAINALQFACVKGASNNIDVFLHSSKKQQSQTSKTKTRLKDKFSTRVSKKKTVSKRSDKSGSEPASIGVKDSSLFLFRALGKVLYCKRDNPADYTDLPKLPGHLAAHYRDPLQVDPEDVLSKSHLSSDFFTAYLHQNYLEFYSSIDDVVTASEYISDSDYLTVDWASRSALKDYAASVAVRGLLFANTSRSTFTGSSGSSLGWKPLHKPQWFDVCKQMRSNIAAAKSLFPGQCAPVELQTQLIPYLAVINTPLHNVCKANLVRELGRMSRYLRLNTERLDEKDVTLYTDSTESQDMVTTSPHTANTDSQTTRPDLDVTDALLSEEEDNVVIDEFED